MSSGEGKTLTHWLVLAMGIGFLIFAVWIWKYIAGLEATGGSFRIHWIAALAYKAFGKAGVSGLVVLVSLGCFWAFFRDDSGDE
jgi:hypothetical protein